jgi:endonuclease YncB( thermonuclease family)
VYWYDGDTVYMLGGAVRGVVRLYGIDAPERGQRGFGAARDALKLWTVRGPVVVTPVQLDRYGRIVAHLVDRDGGDVGLRLLEAGLVWWEYRWAAGAVGYKAAQAAARAAGVGLWASRPWGWAPWVWRRRQRVGW